jgi:hypothetical protein
MKILLASLLVILAFQVYGQEKPQARLFDEFGKSCREDFQVRIDSFHNELNNNPKSTGYAIFYGSKTLEARNLSYFQILSIYPKERKLPIQTVRGANQKEEKTQFWIIPAGAELPKVTADFFSTEITKPTLFDSVWADFHRFYGELNIYDLGFLDLGCDFPPNQTEFAKILGSNPNLNGRLVIFNSNKNRADRVAKFAVNELTKTYKVSPKRLTTTYGGKRSETTIEFWLVPKKKNP